MLGIALWFLGLALAAPPAPTAHVGWERGEAVLRVVVSEGYHLDPVTPGVIRLRWRDRELSVRAAAHELFQGVVLGPLRGERLSGVLELTLCEDLTSRCGVIELRVRGEVPRQRNHSVQLDAAPPVRASNGPIRSLTVAQSWGSGDSERVLAEARRVADETGRILLIDIAAVGCPPCDLLWNEVLDAEQPGAVLDGFVIARIDADHPHAWELKSTFGVRGYPTLLAVDPGDRERSRLVGYAGRQEVEAWLSRVRMQRGADADVLQAGPASVGPERAAQIAWMLARQGRDGLAPWLDRAAAAPESPYFRLARVVTRPTIDDARWLVERSAGTALDWVPQARILAQDSEGRALLLTAVRRDLAGTTGVRAADLLTLAAELLDDASAPLLYAAAASSMRARIVAGEGRGRGHATTLAALMERSGDVRGGLELLGVYSARFPAEPTFFLARARMLSRAGRLDEALLDAQRAVLVAWGDNLLQAAQTQVDLLIALERPDEARAVAQRVLAEAAPAPMSLHVRTHHYRDGLRRVLRDGP